MFKEKVKVNKGLILVLSTLAIIVSIFLVGSSIAGSSWYAEVQEKVNQTTGKGM